MYNLHRIATWILILVSPARLVAALPLALPADLNAQVAYAKIAPYNLTFEPAKYELVTAKTAPQPNFDTDVMQPIKAEQAKVEAAAAAEAAAKALAQTQAEQTRAKSTPVVVAGDDVYAQLRLCEAGGDYTRNSGNGYYGAYQYDMSTWSNYGGYARADLAPANVQDEKIHLDVARRGFSPWPACARKLGLL